MKHYLLTLLLLLTVDLSYGQAHLQLESSQVSSYVNEVFGEGFSENQPELTATFTNLLNNRIEFKVETQDQTEKYPLISSYPLMNKINPDILPVDSQSFDLNAFNPLHYDFGFFSKEINVIRIDGTQYLMIVHPQ